MINKYNIGVFDSGVGGTTVLKEILELLPNENILYYGDSGNSPYGEKTTEEIQQLCKKIVQFFIDHNCKTVVIACNTATAAALQYLQHQFDIPIIGVITATAGAKTAIKITKNNSINILSTSFTALSKAYAKEIAKFAPDAKVFQEGCPEFCPMIEKGWETYSNRQKILKEHMQNLPSSSDTLILGCTHYPIIKNDIENKGNIVDPAKETAIQLNDLLISKNIKIPVAILEILFFFVSGDLNKFKTIAEKF